MKHFSMIQCGMLLPNASKALSHTNCFPYFVQITVLIEMLIFHAVEEIKQSSTLRITLITFTVTKTATATKRLREK